MTKGSQTTSDFPLLSIMNGKRGLPSHWYLAYGQNQSARPLRQIEFQEC